MAQSEIVLVTGGSRGLGREMAMELAKHGKDLILTYRTKKEEAGEVVRAIRHLGQKAQALPLDVADSATFSDFLTAVKKALSETFQSDRIHYLINNAGIGIHVPFAETRGEQLDRLYEIHLKGPYLLTRQLLPIIADGGGIVNVSSGLARFSLPGYAAYAAMKGAVETLTRYQAKELGARKIRANTIAPGAIETDFGGGTVRDNKAVNDFIASATALGRVGMPEDIGGVVAFLCTDQARWINAQRIEVSGGMML
jgi:NAD(P)-dependent dehydrogenase (short-subunit alcohol dehydrogenase family)